MALPAWRAETGLAVALPGLIPRQSETSGFRETLSKLENPQRSPRVLKTRGIARSPDGMSCRDFVDNMCASLKRLSFPLCLPAERWERSGIDPPTPPPLCGEREKVAGGRRRARVRDCAPGGCRSTPGLGRTWAPPAPTFARKPHFRGGSRGGPRRAATLRPIPTPAAAHSVERISRRPSLTVGCSPSTPLGNSGS